MARLFVCRRSPSMRFDTDYVTCSLFHEDVPCGHENKDRADQCHLQKVVAHVQCGEERIYSWGNC